MARKNALLDVLGDAYVRGMARNVNALAEIAGKPFPDPRVYARGAEFVPGVGDAVGVGQDVRGYVQDPNSLTPLSGLLSLAAMAPAIPRIRPELAGKAADFAYGSADEMDDFLYHVTTEPNAKKILKEGFKGGSGKSLFGGGYASHSKDKVFLTDKGSVGYWRDRIEEGLDNSMDNPPPLVVLKIPRNSVGELFPDDAAGIAASSYWFKP